MWLFTPLCLEQPLIVKISSSAVHFCSVHIVYLPLLVCIVLKLDKFQFWITLMACNWTPFAYVFCSVQTTVVVWHIIHSVHGLLIFVLRHLSPLYTCLKFIYLFVCSTTCWIWYLILFVDCMACYILLIFFISLFIIYTSTFA